MGPTRTAGGPRRVRRDVYVTQGVVLGRVTEGEGGTCESQERRVGENVERDTNRLS